MSIVDHLPIKSTQLDESSREVSIPAMDGGLQQDESKLEEEDDRPFKLKKPIKEWEAKSTIPKGPDFFGAVSTFSSLLQKRDPSKACIDHSCFRIHYKLTIFLLLVSASFFICSYISKAYGGILCYFMTNNDGDKLMKYEELKLEKSAISSFCWMSSIMIGSPAVNEGVVGIHKISHGLTTWKAEDSIKNRTFYQFVPHILLCQAIFFYIPHFIWKSLEQKKMQNITTGIISKDLTFKQYKEARQALGNFLYETFHCHKVYAFQYYFCGILCLVNVGVQMMALNNLFDKVFMVHGLEVLAMTLGDVNQRNDELLSIFPRMSRCQFKKYGPSGTIENKDIVCLLPLNLVSEKVFVIMWFWFVFIGFLATFYMLYITATIYVPSSIRKVVFQRQHPTIPDDSLDVLFKTADAGDWFMLHLLSMNLDSDLFADSVKTFASKFKQEP